MHLTAFAEGQRTITRHPEADDSHRWQGTIDNPGYPGRVWRDGTIEGVITDMDRDLGPVEESAYRITE